MAAQPILYILCGVEPCDGPDGGEHYSPLVVDEDLGNIEWCIDNMHLPSDGYLAVVTIGHDWSITPEAVDGTATCHYLMLHGDPKCVLHPEEKRYLARTAVRYFGDRNRELHRSLTHVN